jgi:hypothetical protein
MLKEKTYKGFLLFQHNMTKKKLKHMWKKTYRPGKKKVAFEEKGGCFLLWPI